jgi:hypothetical protein
VSGTSVRFPFRVEYCSMWVFTDSLNSSDGSYDGRQYVNSPDTEKGVSCLHYSTAVGAILGFMYGAFIFCILVSSNTNAPQGTLTIIKFGAGPNGIWRTLRTYMLSSGATFGYIVTYPLKSLRHPLIRLSSVSSWP